MSDTDEYKPLLVKPTDSAWKRNVFKSVVAVLVLFSVLAGVVQVILGE